MLTGENLIDDIERCQLLPNEFAIWWLGQHGFVLKFGSTAIYIDPYLSPDPDRLVKPLLRPSEITNAHLVLGTHDHDDHIDRPAWPIIAQASPQALFIVPDLLRETLARDLGIASTRLLGLDDGRSISVGDIRVTGIAAAHEFLDRDPSTGKHPYLGYVIEGPGCALYHAGDTCNYEGLQTKLKKWRFDLMILPINGRDAARLASGCIGNMTYQEAADLAGALAPGLTIPAHYDMFASNSEDPTLFVQYMQVKYPHLQVRVCQHGQRTIIARRKESTDASIES